MFVVALTGGVGSGKSTVADELARKGAVIVDTDMIAREVVAPGTEGLAAVAERFGRHYLKADGSLDRAALAGRVFSDRAELDALNAIVHPLIRSVTAERLAQYENSDAVVVVVIPLLVESGSYPSDFIVVVDCDDAVAVSRLVRTRNWSEEEARRRRSLQASREERNAIADAIVDNSGDRSSLEAQIGAVWDRISELASSRT